MILNEMIEMELTLEAPTHKIVKRTQKIRQQQSTNYYLGVFDHFLRLVLKGPMNEISKAFIKRFEAPQRSVKIKI